MYKTFSVRFCFLSPLDHHGCITFYPGTVQRRIINLSIVQVRFNFLTCSCNKSGSLCSVNILVILANCSIPGLDTFLTGIHPYPGVMETILFPLNVSVQLSQCP